MGAGFLKFGEQYMQLLALGQNIPPGKEIKQLTVFPQIIPIIVLRMPSFNDKSIFSHLCILFAIK
jgi:uncharacterized protein (DUF934 family)